jgi:hypothetical protein
MVCKKAFDCGMPSAFIILGGRGDGDLRMMDAFIIEKIREEERRREERKPCLRLPVYIDSGCESDRGMGKDREKEGSEKSISVVIDFS